MENLFIVVVVLLLALPGVLSWWHSKKAHEGVAFYIGAEPAAVGAALEAAFAGSGVRGLVSSFKAVKLELPPSRSDGLLTYRYGTEIGDEGVLVLTPAKGGSDVRAHTTVLFLGRKPNDKSGLVEMLTRSLHRALRVRPNCQRMKRFQDSFERKINKQLTKPVR